MDVKKHLKRLRLIFFAVLKSIEGYFYHEPNSKRFWETCTMKNFQKRKKVTKKLEWIFDWYKAYCKFYSGVSMQKCDKFEFNFPINITVDVSTIVLFLYRLRRSDSNEIFIYCINLDVEAHHPPTPRPPPFLGTNDGYESVKKPWQFIFCHENSRILGWKRQREFGTFSFLFSQRVSRHPIK